MHTAESNFLNFVIEYLSEIETEFENTLACLSGAQMGSNHGKNWRSKISWHTPFKQWKKKGELLLSIHKIVQYTLYYSEVGKPFT